MKNAVNACGRTIGAILWPEAWLLGFLIGFGNGWLHQRIKSHKTRIYPETRVKAL